MNVNETQKKIIIALYQGDAASYGEIMFTYKGLKADTKLTLIALKRGVRALVRAKIVSHGPAINGETGAPCGSGFMLTSDGDKIAEQYDECKEI